MANDITSPAADSNVTGNVTVIVAADAAATAVKVQVGHIDYGLLTWHIATRIGSTNNWSITWASNKSLADGTTTLDRDFPTWLRAHVTTPGGTVQGPYIKLHPNNFPVSGLTPAVNAAYNQKTNLDGTVQDYTDSFLGGVYGYMNNPDGSNPVTIVTGPNGKKFARVTMDNEHGSAQVPPNQDFPVGNPNPRWQGQSSDIPEGTDFFVGYSYIIPSNTSTVAGAYGFPTPTTSHISISQLIGGETGGFGFTRGLSMMYDARTQTSQDGTSDMTVGYMHQDRNDLGHGWPALLFELPFNRGQVVDLVWRFGMSKDYRKGYMELYYRLAAGPLQRVAFFGISGNYRIPCALIPPLGANMKFHQHIYRAIDKWDQVTMYFGEMKIATTLEEADPKGYGGSVVFTNFSVEASVDPPKIVFTQFEAYAVGSNATVVFSQFEAYAQTLGASVVLTQFEAYAVDTAVVAVVAGPVAGEPGEAITISGAASTGSPDTFLWTQLTKPANVVGLWRPGVSGAFPDLALSGTTTNTLTFPVPILPPDDINYPNDQPYVYTLRLQCGIGGLTTSQDFNFTVFPHLMWRWSPAPPYTKEPVTILLASL